MKNRGLLMAVLMLGSVATGVADVTVKESDISGNLYTYELTGQRLKEQFFNADVLASESVEWRETGSDETRRIFVRPIPQRTSAEFIVKFVFTGSKRPKHMTVTDRLDLFHDARTPQNVIITTEWSVDGSAYLKIKSLETSKTPDTSLSNGRPVTVQLSSKPETIYYRVTFKAESGVFLSDANQWGRGREGDVLFSVQFGF